MAAMLLAVGCRSAGSAAPAAFASERISVTRFGAGPDVVLIAGAGALATEVWSGTVAAVPGYRYHVVQVAGFGGFPPRGNAADGPLIQPIADEIARYIREGQLDRPALIGLSMGGSLAMRIAAREPELIAKIMVLDMVPFMGVFIQPPGSNATVESVRPGAEKRLARMLSEPEEERRKSLAASVAAMVRTESLRERVLAHGLASDHRVLARAMYELFTLDQREDIARFSGPITVLYVHAPLIPLDEAQTDAVYRASFASVPHAKLIRIPDSYHFIMLDQPERFASEVRAFLE